MLWSDTQQAAARAEGWELVDTVDSGSSRPMLRIFGCRDKTNLSMQHQVVDLAKTGSILHVQALRAIYASAHPDPKQRKK